MYILLDNYIFEFVLVWIFLKWFYSIVEFSLIVYSDCYNWILMFNIFREFRGCWNFNFVNIYKIKYVKVNLLIKLIIYLIEYRNSMVYLFR